VSRRPARATHTLFRIRVSRLNRRPVRPHAIPLGIGCMGNVPPGTTPNSQPSPESYPADATGKHGVPALSAGELETLNRTCRLGRSKALRFAWSADHRASSSSSTRTTARARPGAGYPVLNDDCTSSTSRAENPYYTDAGTLPRHPAAVDAAGAARIPRRPLNPILVEQERAATASRAPRRSPTGSAPSWLCRRWTRRARESRRVRLGTGSRSAVSPGHEQSGLEHVYPTSRSDVPDRRMM
jgi:hypothetical protein